MSLAIIYSRTCAGISAPLVTVETHLARGIPKFLMVGLPEAAVKESRDRVRSALINSNFEFPKGRITVNLAPADLPKDGGRFDLPIALGILAASKQIPMNRLAEYEFTGELALSGEIRPVRGVLPLVLAAKQANRTLVVPQENASEAGLVKDVSVLYAKHILEVCAYLKGRAELTKCEPPTLSTEVQYNRDLADVHGQAYAKRALEVAAAGKHSLLFMGPPGTGKTMLANRLTSILPPLTETQALESAAISSISSSGFDYKQWHALPFRAPHHSSSSVALVGGGRPPKPGEISLAHHGVLFLDELPEYNRHVLEALREPLESGQVTISRAAFQTVFPAQFQLIAAMNPCPCGHSGNPTVACQCTSEQVQRYITKLSGPLLDRIDMHIEVPALPPEVLAKQTQDAESSHLVQARVILARDRQQARQAKCNAALTVRELDVYAALSPSAQTLLTQVMQRYHFSARVYHRLIKLARTLADLAQNDTIVDEHLSEAITFRALDRAKSDY